MLFLHSSCITCGVIVGYRGSWCTAHWSATLGNDMIFQKMTPYLQQTNSFQHIMYASESVATACLVIIYIMHSITDEEDKKKMGF